MVATSDGLPDAPSAPSGPSQRHQDAPHRPRRRRRAHRRRGRGLGQAPTCSTGGTTPRPPPPPSPGRLAAHRRPRRGQRRRLPLPGRPGRDLIIVSGFQRAPAVETSQAPRPSRPRSSVVAHPHSGEAVKAFVVVADGFAVGGTTSSPGAPTTSPTTVPVEGHVRGQAAHNVAGKVLRHCSLQAPRRRGGLPARSLRWWGLRGLCERGTWGGRRSWRSRGSPGEEGRTGASLKPPWPGCQSTCQHPPGLADEKTTISSERLAERAGVGSRRPGPRDLSYLGSYGTRGVGLRRRVPAVPG